MKIIKIVLILSIIISSLAFANTTKSNNVKNKNYGKEIPWIFPTDTNINTEWQPSPEKPSFDYLKESIGFKSLSSIYFYATCGENHSLETPAIGRQVAYKCTQQYGCLETMVKLIHDGEYKGVLSNPIYPAKYGETIINQNNVSRGYYVTEIHCVDNLSDWKRI